MSQKRRLGVPGSGATATSMIMLLSLAALRQSRLLSQQKHANAANHFHTSHIACP